MKLTEDEQKALLALSELEPASLESIAVKTGIEVERLKEILETLARKWLLRERESSKDTNDREPSPA